VHHRVSIEDEKFVYTNDFIALQESTPFAPFRKTKKPYIHGTQTAVVVGPSGKEIHTDEHGRIWVQFHWDRDGKDDGANCYPIRCTQFWAHAGYGFISVPRIGMEVVISFIEGDPDKPLVIGCVYNGKNRIPTESFKKPEILTLKTRSTPDGGEKSNVMSFDDTNNEEKITFNATKDYEVSSIADDNSFLVRQAGANTKTQTQVVDGLLEFTIEKGEYKNIIGEGNYSMILNKGSYMIGMDDGDSMLTIKKGNYEITLNKGKMLVTAKEEVTIKTDDVVNIEALKDITIKSKTGGITLDAAKDIVIKAKMNLKEEGALGVKISGLTGMYEGLTMATLKGPVAVVTGPAVSIG
jgi:type VI secretion system secreted protein VgrG